MKPKLKKIIIAGVVICVAGGVIVAVKKSLDGNGSVDVESVSNLNIGYMDNPLSSSGMVYDEENQAVYADGTKTITQVFVNVGDQVHAGDRLLSYDLTSLNLAVELSRLETDRIANNITLAEHELVQLEQTKPDPEVTPDPTPSRLYRKLQKKMKTEDIHMWFLCLRQRMPLHHRILNTAFRKEPRMKTVYGRQNYRALKKERPSGITCM